MSWDLKKLDALKRDPNYAQLVGWAEDKYNAFLNSLLTSDGGNVYLLARAQAWKELVALLNRPPEKEE